jgi:hypothetical protein
LQTIALYQNEGKCHVDNWQHETIREGLYSTIAVPTRENWECNQRNKKKYIQSGDLS